MARVDITPAAHKARPGACAGGAGGCLFGDAQVAACRRIYDAAATVILPFAAARVAGTTHVVFVLLFVPSLTLNSAVCMSSVDVL